MSRFSPRLSDASRIGTEYRRRKKKINWNRIKSFCIRFCGGRSVPSALLTNVKCFCPDWLTEYDEQITFRCFRLDNFRQKKAKKLFLVTAWLPHIFDDWNFLPNLNLPEAESDGAFSFLFYFIFFFVFCSISIQNWNTISKRKQQKSKSKIDTSCCHEFVIKFAARDFVDVHTANTQTKAREENRERAKKHFGRLCSMFIHWTCLLAGKWWFFVFRAHMCAVSVWPSDVPSPLSDCWRI